MGSDNMVKTTTMAMLITLMLMAGVASGIAVSPQDNQTPSTDIDKVFSEQVTNILTGFDVVNIIGDKKMDGNDNMPISQYVQVIRMTVKLQPSSADINMEEVIIYVTDGNRYAYLTFDNTFGNTPEYATYSTYVVEVIRDKDGSFTTHSIVSKDALITIIISLDKNATDLTLDHTHNVHVEIIPQNGQKTYETMTIVSPSTDRYVTLL
jgi:archaellin